MTTVWQRLADSGRTSVSFPTFRRYVIEAVRSADPARLTVLLPEPTFGEAMEIDYGRLGMWTDPVRGRRRTVWAFVATPRASGMHFVHPVLQMDRATWLTCHTETLAFLGGSPRFWMCDNLKTGVLSADLYDPRLNRAHRARMSVFDIAAEGGWQDIKMVQRYTKSRPFEELQRMPTPLSAVLGKRAS